MIKSLTVTNPKGESLKLDLMRPGLSGLAVKSIDGLGPPQASIKTSEIATMDGVLYVGSRLEIRNIVISLIMMEQPSVEVNRLKTYRYFPVMKSVEIVVETDDKTVKINGYVESNEPEIFAEQEETKISIICPDPYFYDVNESVVGFSDVLSLFEFEFENASVSEKLIEMSEIRNDTRSLITYPGDGDTGLLIKIQMYAPVTKIEMYNSFTGGSMKIDASKLPSTLGSTFRVNDVLEISTKRGDKSVTLVRSGNRSNAITCLTRNAEWFQLTAGDNIFSYAIDDGDNDSNVSITFAFDIAYEGV